MEKFAAKLIWGGAAALFLTMAINIVDVLGTKLLGASIPGTIDFTEELMVFLTMLPLASVALRERHIRFSLFEERVPVKVRRPLRAFQFALATFICAFVTWRASFHLRGVLQIMEMKRGVDFPVWPASLTVCFSFGLLSLAWALLLFKVLSGGDHGA